MSSYDFTPIPLNRRRRPTSRRFLVIVVLVSSMVLTLLGRLYYVQLLEKDKPTQTSGLLHDAAIVVPAPRGVIVDSTGAPLVDNTSVQVLTVSYDTLQQRPDHGAAVLAALADLLDTSASALAAEITPCSPKVPAPCWTGEPYQPVPVAANVPSSVVFAVGEHREQFPGVAIETESLADYPGGSLASHVLGYTSQITAADKKKDPSLSDSDQIGVSGLEESYDSILRGVDGKQVVQLSPQGYSVGAGSYTAPTQGDTLVTSINAKVQKLAESSLAQQIKDSRAAGKPATSGAVVVMDPQTGRVIAAASYPTYDPQEFVGGISDADYAKLTAPSANDPLLSRAIAGQYAPGSTFKLITSSSLLTHKEINTTSDYPCPGSVTIDGRVKTNYDSEVLGNINLENALGYSCDTFFYEPEANEYYRDQARVAKGEKPLEYLQAMAADYGVGSSPGIDLPAGEQAAGSYADRETRLARWNANKTQYCADAKSGFPDDKNAADRAYLTELAKENCTDGWRYRAGDNADMAIGQGETTMSPLQLAVAYSALVNGGRIWEPTIGWAEVNAAGKVVKTIKPTLRDRVPVKQSYLNYIANSLNFSRGWAVSGAFAYLGVPYKNEIGGKTGTAEVFGKADTSWLATWGPIVKTKTGAVSAKFVVVGMVEQAGTGATAAGPMLKRIWDGLLGYKQPAVIKGSQPATTLPKLKPQVQVSGK
ncbi:penicillin-binding transpeptidase domain-containing protein [Jatrophihabitans sp.]|uniref:penicillin-binding transpeptidase domain-containing protein n=1 Tax=Jatrophihabitans sp. TaxID=1932789 RepID=UPI0030C6D2E8|nr:penicillin-binding protein 2 [Jatrophihabitans sp.]